MCGMLYVSKENIPLARTRSKLDFVLFPITSVSMVTYVNMRVGCHGNDSIWKP